LASIFSSSTNGTPWMVRTDFSDPNAWESVCAAAAADPSGTDDPLPGDAFGLVDDAEFEGLTAAGLIDLEPDPYETYFLVDRITVTHPEYPILAVDVSDEPGRSFRLIPSAVSDFAVNMLIGNMDFADFADAVGDDGIFRTFGPDRNTPVLPHDRPPAAPVDLVKDAPPVDSQTPPLDDSTIAPTIRLKFGQQWPPDQELPSWWPTAGGDVQP
jgi:hypothetical protein